MRKPSVALLLLLGCGSSSGDAKPPVDAGVEAAAPSPLGDLLTISEVAAYQTVKVDVMKDGAPIAKFNAPLMTLKEGIFRVYVTLSPKKWRAKSLEAELHLISGTERTLMDKKTSLERQERFHQTEGRFVFRDLPPGSYRVSASDEVSAQYVAVALGDGEVRSVTLTLVELVTLTGRVVDIRSGEPMSGVRVSAA